MSGFIKLHRQLADHWVNSRPEWFQCWVHILMATDYTTGRVCLTDVPVRKMMSRQSWHRLIGRFVADGMLSDVEVARGGYGVGNIQTATVCNWGKYHSSASTPRENSVTANATVVRQQSRQNNNVLHVVNETVTDDTVTLPDTRSVTSNYPLKEIKEIKKTPSSPPTPPQLDIDLEPPAPDDGAEGNRVFQKNNSAHVLRDQYPQTFSELAKLKNAVGINSYGFTTWCTEILERVRLYGDDIVRAQIMSLLADYAPGGDIKRPYRLLLSKIFRAGEPILERRRREAPPKPEHEKTEDDYWAEIMGTSWQQLNA